MEATTGVTIRFDVGSYVLISYHLQKDECKTTYEIASTIKGSLSGWLMCKVTSTLVKT